MELAQQLERIENWLRENRPEYYALLEPPASKDAIQSAEEDCGLEFSLPFKSLYQWHNGQRPREFTPLIFNLTFMTLPQVVETKKALDDVASFDQWERDSWWPNWIPFLDNGGGDFLCFDLRGFKTGNSSQLLWFDHETHQHEVIHDNLEAFLADLHRRMLNDDLNLA